MLRLAALVGLVVVVAVLAYHVGAEHEFHRTQILEGAFGRRSRT